ncbi:MAG: hypothetical protein M0Z42_21215 [Actinomycetota bacterium]|nr:hypothetical protein [Actinomycetota bacterium]
MKTRPTPRGAGALIATALVLAGTGIALPASGALSLSASGTGSGSTASAVLASSVCGSAAGGYYEVAADGGVFTFGGARFYGSPPAASPDRSPGCHFRPSLDSARRWGSRRAPRPTTRLSQR